MHLRKLNPAGTRQLRSCKTVSVVRPRTQRSALEDGSPGDRLAEVQALDEAIQLYKQAQDLSQRQVLQELVQMEVAEMQYYKDDSVEGLPQSSSQGSSGSSATNVNRSGSTRISSPHPGSIRRVLATPAAVKPLQSFWVEQGLQAQIARIIAEDMVAAQSPYCDVSLLAMQVQRLGRVIPGNVQDMVARDWRILDATPRTVAQHYVQLVELFQNSLDVSELARKQPKLLYCEDLVGQFETVVRKLVQLHPSHSEDEARALLMEYPDLMFRMQYYMHVRTLDELPFEIQNFMITTGGGLQALWQYYHQDSISPRFLEDKPNYN